MKTNETSTRLQAITWWNELSKEKQIDLQHIHRSPSRHPLNAIGLTGREIEEIWRRETQTEIISEPHIDKYGDLRYNAFETKPNQKQFKKFDEDLFKAYISKFSEEDKVAALRVLFKSIGITSKDKLEYYLAKY